MQPTRQDPTTSQAPRNSSAVIHSTKACSFKVVYRMLREIGRIKPDTKKNETASTVNAKSLKCCVVFLATLGSSDLDPLLIVEGVNEPVLRRGHILFVANVADDMQAASQAAHLVYTSYPYKNWLDGHHPH